MKFGKQKSLSYTTLICGWKWLSLPSNSFTISICYCVAVFGWPWQVWSAVYGSVYLIFNHFWFVINLSPTFWHLFFLLKLRDIINRLHERYQNYKKYQQVVTNMESRFPEASSERIAENGEWFTSFTNHFNKLFVSKRMNALFAETQWSLPEYCHVAIFTIQLVYGRG